MRSFWRGSRDTATATSAPASDPTLLAPGTPLDLDAPRAARSILSNEVALQMQAGIMDYRYKGVLALKCPFDLSIYTELLSDLRPGTILEFGSNMGGTALWLADTLASLGLSETALYTLDIEHRHEFTDPRFTYMHCDAGDIRAHLSDEFMAGLARPLLFIEDASHQYRHTLNVLEFFDEVSQPGDYIIVEDGIISIMDAEPQYDGGPHRAIYEFLRAHRADYEIDRARCDRFGYNATWNIDGYIRRIAKSG